jgi:hypothetical protein
MTKLSLNIRNENYNVSATLLENGVPAPWAGAKNNTYHNKFKLSVSTAAGRTSFTFYGSMFDYQNGVTELDAAALRSALQCFFSDASSASGSFTDFCSEIGYNEDSRAAYKIYTACRKSAAKVARLTSTDVYALIEALDAE